MFTKKFAVDEKHVDFQGSLMVFTTRFTWSGPVMPI